MKKIVYIFSLAIAAILISCSQTIESPETETEQVSKEPVVANAEVNMSIDGMTCVMGCKGAIEKSLNSAKGVAKCDVDFENATAKISFDNTQVNEEEILALIHTVNNGAYKAAIIDGDSETHKNTEA